MEVFLLATSPVVFIVVRKQFLSLVSHFIYLVEIFIT
jgi:hypothetical protein